MEFKENPPIHRDISRDPAARQQLKSVSSVLESVLAEKEAELESVDPSLAQAAHLRGLLIKLRDGSAAIDGAVSLLTPPKVEQYLPPAPVLSNLPLDV